MGGSKRFNIWIAYSDLFTNLSVFLFISALGMFAALGSGSRAPDGVAGSSPCGTPEIIESMTEKSTSGDSALKLIGTSKDSYPCTIAFSIEDIRFPSSDSDIDELTHGEQLEARVCIPIWLTLVRRDFNEHEGSVWFRGFGAEENDSPRCNPDPQDAPSISGVSGSTVDFLRNCERNPSGRECAVVGRCSDGSSNEQAMAICREIEAVRSWDALQTRICLEGRAREQARALLARCAAFRNKAYFPSRRLQQSGMMDDADDLRYWNKVSEDPLIQGMEMHSSTAVPVSALSRMPNGAFVVELRFRR